MANAQLLDPQALAVLESILRSLLGTDNETRTHAEKVLSDEWQNAKPAALLVGLATMIKEHADESIRAFAAILLRRLGLKTPPGTPDTETTTVWTAVGEDVRGVCQVYLLHSLSSEPSTNVRHKVCDTISELARENMIKLGPWNDLLAAIFEGVKSTSAVHREAVLRIVAAVPSLISKPEVAEVGTVIGILSNSLAYQEMEVKVTALHASVSYMLDMLIPDDITAEASDAVRNQLMQLIPVMLHTLTELISNEEKLVDGLGFLVDLAEEDARIFRNNFPALVEFLTNVMKTQEFESNTRHTALELLLTLAESRPPMVRKHPQYTNTLIPLLLEWMSSVEDDARWHQTDDLSNDDDDNEEDYIIAEQALDRLSLALGGKSVLPVAFNLVPKMLSNYDSWSQRHAGLMAISVMGEGCKEVMSENLGQFVSLVIPYLRDPHPRVRYAACNTVGQMCTDFAPDMQNKHSREMLENLIGVMDDVQNPRVQAHCAAALVNLSEDIRKEQLAPYLDEMFTKLVGLLNSNKTYVQEQAITTIATIADSAEDLFAKYYNQIFPMLINILHQAVDKRFRLLRGKALECASLIALAVGKEVFAPQANEFLQLLTAMQQQERDDDDPISSYLLVAWARICKVLGADFVPYLQIVMPPLLASAEVKPDVALIDADESTEDYPEEDGWEFVAVDGQKFGIKTSVLEDKNTAVEMLACYARDLKALFLPWVEKVMEVATKLLKFYFHEGVRHAAAAIIPLLFGCMKDAGCDLAVVSGFWTSVSASLLELMISDVDPEFSASVFTSFAESVANLDPQVITPSNTENFVTAVNSQLLRFTERCNERASSRKDADYDEEEENTLQANEGNDEALLIEVARAVHELFKATGTNFLPYFDGLLDALTSFTAHPVTYARHFAICVYGDLIDFGGPASWNYQGRFLDAIGRGIVDPNEDIRQASCYAVGIAAEKGGPNYHAVCAQSVDMLASVIASPNSKSDDNVLATENAIAALGKISMYVAGHAPGVDGEKVLRTWFAALPILNDEQEADHTYRYLLQLLESNNPIILGENNSNIAQILVILTDVLAADIELAEDLRVKLGLMLQSMLQSMPEDVKAQAWNSFSAEKRETLKAKLGL